MSSKLDKLLRGMDTSKKVRGVRQLKRTVKTETSRVKSKPAKKKATAKPKKRYVTSDSQDRKKAKDRKAATRRGANRMKTEGKSKKKYIDFSKN